MTITLTEFKEAVPKGLRNSITQQLVDDINQIAIDPEAASKFRENVISYTDVLNQGRYKVTDYINACLFSSFKLMGYTNQDAWKATFPDKYRTLIARGGTPKELSSYASMYNKGQLVQAVNERTIVKDCILFADIRHAAIMKQFQLMNTASDAVAQKAADSLMKELKMPEKVESTISIGVNNDSVLVGLQNAMNQLASMHREKIIDGTVTAKEVAQGAILIEDNHD